MSVVWKINGTPFGDLGFSGLRRELRSLAPSSVTFRSSRAFDAADISGLALGDVASITRTEGATTVQWFKGVVTAVPRLGASGAEAVDYEISDPWWYLDHLTYQQIFPLNATANPTVTSPATARRAVAFIGQDVAGARITNIAALTEVLDYCIAAGAEFDRGTLPTGFAMPWTQIIAPTCAEAARLCLRWMPDAASRFDFSAETPVLSIVRRADADAVTLNLATIGSIGEIRFTPRPDLQIAHLVIQKISLFDNAFYVQKVEASPSGSTGLEFGSLVIPLDDSTELPTGLADNYRSSLSALQYEGRITLVESECAYTVRPGDVLNFTGGLAAWETMRAQVMQVIEDVDTGETTWVFGPPEHLSVQDMVELLRVARQQAPGYDGPPLISGRRKSDGTGEEPPPLNGTTGDIVGDLNVQGSGIIGGELTVSGGITGSGDLDVSGSGSIGGTLDVGGTLTADGHDVGADLSDHETRIDTLETGSTALDLRVGALETAVGALETDLAALDVRDADQETAQQDLNTSIVGDIETLVDTVNSHSTALTTLATAVDNLESADTALDGRVDALETGATSLDGRVDTLETGATALDGRVDTLETGATALSGRVDTLETGATALDGRVGALETDLGALDTRDAAQETAQQDLNTSIVGDIETLVDTVNAHSTSITTLAGVVDDHEARLATIETLLSGKTTVVLTVCDSGVAKTTSVVGTTPA